MMSFDKTGRLSNLEINNDCFDACSKFHLSNSLESKTKEFIDKYYSNFDGIKELSGKLIDFSFNISTINFDELPQNYGDFSNGPYKFLRSVNGHSFLKQLETSQITTDTSAWFNKSKVDYLSKKLDSLKVERSLIETDSISIFDTYSQEVQKYIKSDLVEPQGYLEDMSPLLAILPDFEPEINQTYSSLNEIEIPKDVLNHVVANIVNAFRFSLHVRDHVRLEQISKTINQISKALDDTLKIAVRPTVHNDLRRQIRQLIKLLLRNSLDDEDLKVITLTKYVDSNYFKIIKNEQNRNNRIYRIAA